MLPKNTREINHDDFYKLNSSEDKIKFLLSYAILAPSTHNTQPWLFKIDGNVCHIYYNPDYTLAEADPTLRNLYISIGCAIENFILAARYFGIFKSVSHVLDGTHVADITIKNNAENPEIHLLPLLNTILTRTNTRGIFDDRKIDDSYIADLKKMGEIEGYLKNGLSHKTITDGKQIEKIASLTKEGLMTAYKRDSFREEMSKWVHNSLTKKKEGMPGYSLKMPFIVSFFFSFMVKHINVGSKLGDLNYMSLKSAPLVNVITAKDNNPLTWLEIGRLSERLMLEFNTNGIRTSIFVASIEMGDLYRQVQELLKTDELPQFLFIAGYTDSIQKLTPRHNLETKLL